MMFYHEHSIEADEHFISLGGEHMFAPIIVCSTPDAYVLQLRQFIGILG